MDNSLNTYICMKEANDAILDRYSIVKSGNRFFKRYAVIVKGSRRHIYTGSLEQCRLVSKALIAAAMDGVQILKEELICNEILNRQ